MERTGGLVVNGGFFRESLTGIRIFEYDIALDILGPAYLAFFSVKLGVEHVSEAYVGGVDKSRIVGVGLIERNAEQSVRGQGVVCVDLIGPVIIYDIDRQRTGLLVVDHDTFGYLIRERCVIGKLTCRIFCKRKDEGIFLTLHDRVRSVVVLDRADDNGVGKEVGKIAALLNVGHSDIDHGTVFHGNGEFLFGGKRLEGFEDPSVLGRIYNSDKSLVAEFHVCDAGNEFFRIFGSRDAEYDSQIHEADGFGAFDAVFVYLSRGGIGILEVDRICENGKSGRFKRYGFLVDVHLQLVIPCGEFFHVDITGAYINGVGGFIVIVPDLV